MKIKVKISVSERDRSVQVSLDDLGVTSKDWEDMTEDEKRKVVRQYADDMPDQPFWELDSFEEI